MAQSTSRFSRFKSDGEFPGLFKPGEGDSRVGRLTGDRVHSSEDRKTGETREVPVLDLVDVKTGEPWSFMSSAWKWLDALADEDPQPGDVVRITRGPDIGQSRDYRLDILERAADKIAKPDVPTDLPQAGFAPADDKIPFEASR